VFCLLETIRPTGKTSAETGKSLQTLSPHFVCGPKFSTACGKSGVLDENTYPKKRI
jgi:hypothetical protein